MKLTKKLFSLGLLFVSASILTACSNKGETASKARTGSGKIYHTSYHSDLADPIMAISHLSEHQHEWKGTRYRLGGNSKAGVDCSGFMQITFRDLFGIDLPRTTNDQAKVGNKISKKELRTGDLVFLKLGEVRMVNMLAFM